MYGLRILAAITGLLCATPREARADVTSWLFVGTGPALMRQNNGNFVERWSLQVETGLGTPPSNRFVIGGLGRTQTHFGEGTDLALLLRVATQSFVTGGWGGTVDLGPYGRFWGTGSAGVAGSLVVGAPWGITLNLGAAVGSHDAQTYTAQLGIDFTRLTIHRRAGQRGW